MKKTEETASTQLLTRERADTSELWSQKTVVLLRRGIWKRARELEVLGLEGSRKSLRLTEARIENPTLNEDGQAQAPGLELRQATQALPLKPEAAALTRTGVSLETRFLISESLLRPIREEGPLQMTCTLIQNDLTRMLKLNQASKHGLAFLSTSKQK